MVGSINGGFQTQVPGATSFQPGATSQPKPEDTLKQNGSGAPINAATQVQTGAGKTEEVSSKTYLSRDNTRPAPRRRALAANARLSPKAERWLLDYDGEYWCGTFKCEDDYRPYCGLAPACLVDVGALCGLEKLSRAGRLCSSAWLCTRR